MQDKEIKKISVKATNPLLAIIESDKRLEKILEAGKEIVLEKGTIGLNLRALGEKLHIPPGNIYRYVDSKRDLWIAIRFTLYDEFLVRFNKIIDEHEGTYLELFLKFSELYLEFAGENYNRFEMLFLLEPPKSEKKGKIEQEIDQYAITKALFELIKQTINAGEIKQFEGLKTYYAIISLLTGAARNEVSIKKHMNITEPLNVKSEINSIQEFRKFILKKVREIYENSSS